MEKAVLENYQRYVERLHFYRGFGYDLEKEREFILDRSLPISGDILEIGTGKGHFALALAKRGFNFTSVDISVEDQEIAKLNLRYHNLEDRVAFKIEDAGRMSFPDRSFDVICSINVFHHLKEPRRVLDEIARLLRPAAKVVLGDFNARGFEIINSCHAREGKVHDRSKHDLDEAKEDFAGKGFDLDEYQSETQRLLVARKKVPVR